MSESFGIEKSVAFLDVAKLKGGSSKTTLALIYGVVVNHNLRI